MISSAEGSETAAISVVIPALDAASTLARTLASVAEAGGLVREIIVVDGGSRDGTASLAEGAGARVIRSAPGRAVQLAAGAATASAPWLLFLHADTALGRGWPGEAAAFVSAPAHRDRAAAFRFALDDPTPAARRIERLVAWRCRRLGLPYGDQGLLIHRVLYDRIGGYRPLPLMEDVDLVRRIGRQRLTILRTAAVTSAARYRRDGWWLRPMRNLCCLSLYFMGVPPRTIAWLYR